MNKMDLVSSVADHSGLSKNNAAKAVDAVIGSITGALKGGDDVRLQFRALTSDGAAWFGGTDNRVCL